MIPKMKTRDKWNLIDWEWKKSFQAAQSKAQDWSNKLYSEYKYNFERSIVFGV